MPNRRRHDSLAALKALVTTTDRISTDSKMQPVREDDTWKISAFVIDD
jgi:hypothetical protein